MSPLSSGLIRKRISREGERIVNETSQSMINLNFYYEEDSPELSHSRSIKHVIIQKALSLHSAGSPPAVIELAKVPMGSNDNLKLLETSDNDIDEDEVDLGDHMEKLELLLTKGLRDLFAHEEMVVEYR